MTDFTRELIDKALAMPKTERSLYVKGADGTMIDVSDPTNRENLPMWLKNWNKTSLRGGQEPPG